MVRIRPSTIELIQTLASLGKPYFTTADLSRVLGLSGKSLSVTLSRLVTTGELRRVRRNAYVLSTQPIQVERIAMAVRFPACLSFESALAHHGILSQLPYSLTLATTRPSAREVIAERDVVYSHLPPALYWGYSMSNGIQMAEPEKALLDQLYLLANGHRSLAMDELDLRVIDPEKLAAYAARFPAYVARHMHQLAERVGTTPLTGVHQGRVAI